MKILVLQDSIDAPGGVESYLASVIPALRERGHSVALLYLERRDGVPRITALDGPVVAASDAAFDALRAWGVEVCFSNNMSAPDIEQRALTQWPVVKFMHGYFGTCLSALKMHAFPARAPCSRMLGPACLAMYVPRRCGPLRFSKAWTNYRFTIQQHRLLPRYAAVIVGSDHMAAEFSRHGVAADRIVTIPQFAPGWHAERCDGRNVLFMGRMTPLKGGDLLIRAVAAASRSLGRAVPLMMSGDGPQRNEWERLAAAHDVAAQFTGWLEGSDRDAAIANAALIAVPSIWPEPFGLVGLEAAAAGVPAIAFDVGGISQWLRHRRSGMLVPPRGGVGGLADAIRELVDDAALRIRLGNGAREVAREMSLDAHVAGLEQVLSRVCAVA